MKNLFLLLLLQTVCFSIPKTTETILVLAQSDKRFYSAVSSSSTWQFDFKLFKRGETDALASSAYSGAMRRSRKLAIDLEPGDYIVHVRLTRRCDQNKVSFLRSWVSISLSANKY